MVQYLLVSCTWRKQHKHRFLFLQEFSHWLHEQQTTLPAPWRRMAKVAMQLLDSTNDILLHRGVQLEEVACDKLLLNESIARFPLLWRFIQRDRSS